jgi:hypothetical protein
MEAINVKDVAPNAFNPKEQDRLTAQFAAYHEHCCDGPVKAAGSFTAILATLAQPVQRSIVVPATWVPLEFWWLDPAAISYIAIVNNAGKGLKKLPTPEEKAEIAAQVIQIGTWEIHPGAFHFGRPTAPTDLLIRSLGKPCPAHITIFPK